MSFAGHADGIDRAITGGGERRPAERQAVQPANRRILPEGAEADGVTANRRCCQGAVSLAQVIFAGQHVQRLLARHQVGDGIGLAMNDNQRTTTQRITDLEGAAQKARLEAIQIAAKIISKENALLAGTAAKPNRNDELAALRTRYAVLVKTADEAQVLIDKLQADDHDTKYHR